MSLISFVARYNMQRCGHEQCWARLETDGEVNRAFEEPSLARTMLTFLGGPLRAQERERWDQRGRLDVRAYLPLALPPASTHAKTTLQSSSSSLPRTHAYTPPPHSTKKVVWAFSAIGYDTLGVVTSRSIQRCARPKPFAVVELEPR